MLVNVNNSYRMNVRELGFYQGGFTLIELMITVSILGILTAMALPSYNVWIQNTRIRTAAESIQTGLQKARVEAVRRNAQVQFTLGVNSAWNVSCVTVTADCPADIEVKAAGEGASTSIGITTVPAGATEIVFTNLGTVLPSPPAASAPFTQVEVDNTSLTSTDKRPLTVMIGAGGIGRMCDSKLNGTSDPRKCL